MDWYICPETGVILPYTGRIDRDGYKMYSDKENCKNCPEINKCSSKQGYRVIRRHIYEELNEQMRENRLSERGKALYKLRKEKVERSFADSKQNHGYRYAMYKGIEKNQNYTWLICATQNMKNIVLKLTQKPKKSKHNYINGLIQSCFHDLKVKIILVILKSAKSMKKSWTLSTV